jgi:hypothetical protein
MNHRTLPRFWKLYKQLPKEVQTLADKSFELLKSDSNHPSLHFKQIDTTEKIWSARVGIHYRALGRGKPDGILWFWIGSHADYDKLIS